jgi:hypothetical protein
MSDRSQVDVDWADRQVIEQAGAQLRRVPSARATPGCRVDPQAVAGPRESNSQYLWMKIF